MKTWTYLYLCPGVLHTGPFNLGFKVRIRNVFHIRHETRGRLSCNLRYVGSTHDGKKGTHTFRPTHTCGQTHTHLPHRAMTKPARLPRPCWQRAAIGNTRPCPVWLAGQCAARPGGLKSHGLAAAAATDHSHLNSFPILTSGNTQSAASLAHSTTSS